MYQCVSRLGFTQERIATLRQWLEPVAEGERTRGVKVDAALYETRGGSVDQLRLNLDVILVNLKINKSRFVAQKRSVRVRIDQSLC